MGHTKFENLKDLKKEFTIIKSWNGIKEKTPGVFYYKSIPFLHFHDKDGKRWADVKTQIGFQSIPIDFNSTPQIRKLFQDTVMSAYEALRVRKEKR